MSRRDRSSDELFTMALAARRKRSTKYAPQTPVRAEPTPQQEALDDLMKSFTTKGVQLLQRYAQEFQELDADGELYVSDADPTRSRCLPLVLPPRRETTK